MLDEEAYKYKPITTKSRRHSAVNEKFMQIEIGKLMKVDIIETFISFWWARVSVTIKEHHKRRMGRCV